MDLWQWLFELCLIIQMLVGRLKIREKKLMKITYHLWSVDQTKAKFNLIRDEEVMFTD